MSNEWIQKVMKKIQERTAFEAGVSADTCWWASIQWPEFAARMFAEEYAASQTKPEHSGLCASRDERYAGLDEGYPCDCVAEPTASGDEEQAYKVEGDGCEHCGRGHLWTVVGPDDVAIGQSWLDKEQADDVADLMNMAYDLASERIFELRAEVTRLGSEIATGMGLQQKMAECVVAKEREWQHYMHNIYSIATGGEKCDEKIALGMATSAVDRLKRANADLQQKLANSIILGMERYRKIEELQKQVEDERAKREALQTMLQSLEFDVNGQCPICKGYKSAVFQHWEECGLAALLASEQGGKS